MMKMGKKACDWCGKVFRPSTKYVEYNDGTAYHHSCLKKVGSKMDLGRW